MVVYMTLLTGTKDEDYEHGNSDLETDHRCELDWEPDEDDVKAELDELLRKKLKRTRISIPARDMNSRTTIAP
jgi:hypothetical protein